jgi:8-oxo-dGTP pyrophosphatase MutT (NUDIX family)
VTLHDRARAALVAWSTPDEQQRELRDAFVAFLDDHPDATSRECRASHLTASALVVSHDGREVLLTQHATVGRWLQLGGHLEPGDVDLAAGALREAREESGIEDLALDPLPLRVDRHGVRCRRPGASSQLDADELDHLDVQFVARAPKNARIVAEGAAPLRWFPHDALPADADAAVRALVRAATSP